MQQANTNIVIRNPFGTMDVPAPDDRDVMEYAATAALAGDAADVNAAAWGSIAAPSDPLEGAWASRWNGGADPTIAGDTPETYLNRGAGIEHVGSRIICREVVKIGHDREAILLRLRAGDELRCDERQ